MVTTFTSPYADESEERKSRIIALIITGAFFVLLLLVLLLVKIITPIPAIPPDREVLTLEVGIVPGSGGDVEFKGGGSQGNTGQPGMEANNDAASNPVQNPPDNGSVTDAHSDNVAAPTGHNPSVNTTPAVNPALEAALNNWNKNKGKATINVGGQGNGNPYTGGLGDGNGDGPGPGTGGDPGTGGNGGSNGNDPNEKNYRHITFKPEIVNPTQEEGKVVVIVHVGRDGKVIPGKNEIGVATTTVNNVLRSTASQSAYHITFNADPNAPVEQAIAIDINFTLK